MTSSPATTEDVPGGEPTPPLLATKLHAPRRRREVVRRTRLTDRIGVTHRPALTLVSAPAGFGKTTLLADWFEDERTSSPSAATWLALDASQNEAAVFGRYFVAALRSIAPQIGATAESLLRSGGPLRAAFEVLVNDLSAADSDMTLMLDDYHTIESSEIHDALSFLVDHAPRGFHVVMATRADPPLPLARWRANGDLLEIRAADLRFSADEAATYLNGAMGLQLTASHVAALERRTEGWIAALQLAALSLQGRSDAGAFIDSFAGDDRFVLDYLADEVLERQTDDIRRFLLQTSVLDRLNGALCDAVTGGTGGKLTLELLDRANLFLVALDDRRHWFRYHHLFADVLRVRLLEEEPQQVAVLHLRASDWFDRHGEPAEAIRHACAGNDVDRAARLIEVAAPVMQRTRQEATLRAWLETLPSALYDDRPVLSVALAGARMSTGDTSGVALLLDNAARWLPPLSKRDMAPIVFDLDEFAALPAQIAVYRAGLALLGGDTAGTVAHATHVLEVAAPSDHLRLGAAAALIGLARWSLGDLDEARRRYSEAIDHFVGISFISDVLGCSLALADIQIAQGRLHDAERTYESALRLATDHAVVRGTADMQVGLAELCLERNDLAGAARHLEIASELGEQAGLPQHPYRWRAATARLRHAHGDLDRALELLDAAERVYTTDFSPSVRPIAALSARLQLARGHASSAVRWAADRGLGVDDDLAYVREYEHITLARILLARADQGSTADAIALLDRLLVAAELGRREGAAIEILVLLALGNEARGDRPAAIGALEQALVRAEPEGHLRVFLDAGPALVPLLRAIPTTSDAARIARSVLAGGDAGQTTTLSSRSRSGLVDELSGRELDVLRLLRTDLTGPEIARELHISINTLRTHTKSIYTKLAATSRREAVRVAADLGL